jgi:abhydrolase domain-containing protein 5
MHCIAAGKRGPAVVCMPGYAAGAAFFYRNLQGLAQHTRVHLVDWLGTGCSGRPPFECKTREESEAWFIDALERWRADAGHEKMVLVGHSLGGYLSLNYAQQYPERVLHLVLVNPAGIVEKPADWVVPEAFRSPFTLRGAWYRAATQAWNAGFTPGWIIRNSPGSRRLTRGYADRRLRKTFQMPEEECNAFEPYLYEVLGGKGSGEVRSCACCCAMLAV